MAGWRSVPKRGNSALRPRLRPAGLTICRMSEASQGRGSTRNGPICPICASHVTLAPSRGGGNKMRVTLDLGRLVAEGKISEDEALRLASLGEGSESPAASPSSPPETSAGPRGRVFANMAMIFGALAVMIGVELLHPSVALGGALAIAALLGGAFLRRRADASWVLLAHALAIGGALGACLAFLVQFPNLNAGLLIVGVFLAANRGLLRSGLIAACPLALSAGWVPGADTGTLPDHFPDHPALGDDRGVLRFLYRSVLSCFYRLPGTRW